jgi:hypothetical protein
MARTPGKKRPDVKKKARRPKDLPPKKASGVKGGLPAVQRSIANPTSIKNPSSIAGAGPHV